jgi:hypothetical protein
MSAKSFIIASLASMASAHMLMSNPVPYATDNSPLDKSGSNFPCKGVAYTGVEPNQFPAGSTQTLSFVGTAVHAGGSCQLSVTTDAAPTKDSVWKVIKSIEGGCPAKDQIGNLEGSNPGYTYDFTVPEIAEGAYTFAWTWFNKIGVREMYMNCAPIEVTGGSGSVSLDSLPDMLVANVGNGCGTTEGQDIAFPNPGNDVDRFNGATEAFGPPVGTCTGAPGAPADPVDVPEPTDVPVVIENPNTELPPPPAQSSAASPPPPVQSSVVAPPTTEPTVVAPPPATGGAGNAAGSACSTEGNWNCIGGTSYQRCAAGMWSPVQAVAAGTTCVAGESATLNLA